MSKRDLHVADPVRLAAANGMEAFSEVDALRMMAKLRSNVGEGIKSPPHLRPPRFVDAASGEQPPEGNKMFMAGGIEETWVAIFGRPDKTKYWLPPQLLGWNVRQTWMSADCDCEHKKGVLFVDGELIHPRCGRALASKHHNFAELRDTILSLNVQVDEDTLYNGHYPSIPGDDVITFDRKKLSALRANASDREKMAAWRGSDTLRSQADNPGNPQFAGESQVLRGGTTITGGRREYREKTHDMVLHDAGVPRDIAKIQAEKKAKRKADFELRKEQIAKKLPRNIGEL